MSYGPKILHEYQFAGFCVRIIESEPGIVHFEQASCEGWPWRFERIEKPMGDANEILQLSMRWREAEQWARQLVGRIGELEGQLSDREAAIGIDLIRVERKRQIEEEGWTAEHDDQHPAGELGMAGASYAANAGAGLVAGAVAETSYAALNQPGPPDWWPWEIGWWKPKEPLTDLVRAGALIAAEIDRLLRHDIKGQVESRPDDAEPGQAVGGFIPLDGGR